MTPSFRFTLHECAVTRYGKSGVTLKSDLSLNWTGSANVFAER